MRGGLELGPLDMRRELHRNLIREVAREWVKERGTER